MASPPIRRGKWAFLRKFNGFAFGVKNTPKPMKTNKQAQDNDTGIETLLSLIPQYAVNEEIVTAISADYLKNRYETAIALKSGDTNLSTQEQQRFLDNCRVIKGVTLGIELRNYLLWEIYSTQQYRATSQNFETFATQLIQRSAGQVRKCVHAGRIRMEMILADMDEIRPTGRQIEILSKVQDDHTVRAWKFALEYMRQQNGKPKERQDDELNSNIEQLEIFEDPCGIATAALDCCRNHLAATMASERKGKQTSLSVYLAVDRLKRHFRPRISLQSLSTFEYDDERASVGQIAEAILATNELENIDVQMIKCFKAPDFSKVVDYALALVQLWHQKEGCDHGETPEDFLAEIADEIYEGTPPKDFVAKRDAILKAFYTAARSSARRPAPGDR